MATYALRLLKLAIDAEASNFSDAIAAPMALFYGAVRQQRNPNKNLLN